MPEDRKEDGLVGGVHGRREPHPRPLVATPRSSRAARSAAACSDAFAKERITEYDIRTQGPDTEAGTLSGGNQQKVVIAREMSRELKLLVAAQPTRGVDVGSIEFIHKRIIETRDAGVPVLVVSTELDEVAALADRIA